MDLEVLSVPAIQKRWVQQMDLCTGKIKDPFIAHPAEFTGKSTAINIEKIRQFCPGVGQTVTAFFIGCQGLKINLQTMDDPRNGGSEALHYCKRQAEKMAVRHGGHGSHSGGTGGNDDCFYSLRKEPMKYKIEKNTVQETLILPLYSRKLCIELYPNLYRDETAVRLLDQLDYDFSEAEKNARSLMQRFGALEVAMRQNDLAFEVRAYLKNHPSPAVVNLGCGLDNTGRACDNGRCRSSEPVRCRRICLLGGIWHFYGLRPDYDRQLH